jgi:hypothetical protein
MKKIVTSLMMLIGLGATVKAQIPAWIEDSVSIAPAYANDVYYSMKNDEVRTEGNKNWHLAFSLSIGDSASVWANHNGGNTFVRVFNIHKDSSQWASVTLADTATGVLAFNNDQGWFQGAFNDIPSADPFNYGWGKYEPTTHNIYGDSLFIVRANGVYYKLFIQKLESIPMKWTFKVGDFSGNDMTYNIDKTPDFTNRLFAYFDLANGADTNREPDINAWDILFTRYTTNAPGSGQFPFNNVVGVLTNKGVKAARASLIHVDTAFVQYYNYANNWNPAISAIGYNWKGFDLGTSTWLIADSNSYFIQDKPGNLYQLQFLSFGGQSTGDIKFRKRMVAPVAVTDVNSSVSRYEFYPVPTQSQLSVMLDSKEHTDAQLNIIDMAGRMIHSQKINIQSGLNAYQLSLGHLSNGQYIIQIKGQHIQIAEKVQIDK